MKKCCLQPAHEFVSILPRFRFERDDSSQVVVHLCSRHARPWPGENLFNLTGCFLNTTLSGNFSLLVFVFPCSINCILFPLLSVQLWMHYKLSIWNGRQEWIVFVFLIVHTSCKLYETNFRPSLVYINNYWTGYKEKKRRASDK